MMKYPFVSQMNAGRLFINFLAAICLFLLIGGTANAKYTAPLPSGHIDEMGYQGKGLKFQHLSYEQGLSNNNVWSVWQDHLGFMWFGTVGGLNRFDGYTFTTYKNIPGDAESLSANLVSVVYGDRDGDIWVGTWEDGLDRIDRETETISHYTYDIFDSTSIGNNAIRTILQDSQGVLWVGTAGGGLNRYDPETDQFVRYQHDQEDPNSLGSDQVFSLLEDADGNLWIGTYIGGLNLYNRDEDNFTRFFSQPEGSQNLDEALIDALAMDQEGNLWLGTWGHGLYRFDLEGDDLTRFIHQADDSANLSSDFVLSLAVDHSGILWIGTDGGGLNLLQPDGSAFKTFTHHAGDDESISNNVVRSLFVDREGTLWIGTWGGGVDRLSHEYNQFNHYKYSPSGENSLSDNNVLSLYQDEDGIVWAGTEVGGVNRVVLRTGEIKVYQAGTEDGSLPSNAVRSIHPAPGGDLWVGTLGGGLARFDPVTEIFTPVPFLDGSVCSDVYALAGEGDMLWVGCSDGLVAYSFVDDTFEYYDANLEEENSLSNNFITDLLLDPEGILWIGTFGGLNCLDTRTGEFLSYLHDREDPASITHNNITTLYIDSVGDLWIGTLAGGLNKFNLETETFTNYLEYQREIGDAILGITEGGTPGSGDEQELWLSSYQGLIRFSPGHGVVRIYDAADGLQGNIFNPSALFRSESGELMFGGTNGFNIFNPDLLTFNETPPPVVITELSLDLEPVEIGEGSVLQQSINLTDRLELSYENRVISFEFAALSYNAPEKNQFRYRLENFEDDWNQVSSDRRFVSYTNLDPGEYTFQVVASNADGVWSEDGINLKIVITPPWWETWWFTTLTILLTGAVIVIAIRYRVRALEFQRNRLEELVAERTQEINETSEKLGVLNKELEAFAYSVSHDLRAPIRAMNGYSTILMEEHADQLDASGRDYVARSLNAVNRMEKMIDAVLELSRMTRHDLEKEPLDLSEIAETNAGELSQVEPDRKVTWKIQPDIRVVGDKRVVMVVLENLMGNAWKFTRKRDEAVIEIGVLKEGDERIYFVKDNGVGLDTSKEDRIFTLFQRMHPDDEFEGYGVGLAIARRAVLKHGGRIWVESVEGEGATFFFTL
jgi:signal transduction histidine kinase/ligand-binding sensor domain-containing protein